MAVTPRGNVMFIREEGLATIRKAEFVNVGFEDTNFKVTLPTSKEGGNDMTANLPDKVLIIEL